MLLPREKASLQVGGLHAEAEQACWSALAEAGRPSVKVCLSVIADRQRTHWQSRGSGRCQKQPPRHSHWPVSAPGVSASCNKRSKRGHPRRRPHLPPYIWNIAKPINSASSAAHRRAPKRCTCLDGEGEGRATNAPARVVRPASTSSAYANLEGCKGIAAAVKAVFLCLLRIGPSHARTGALGASRYI